MQHNKPERRAYRRAPGPRGRAAPGYLRFRSPLSPSPASRFPHVALPVKRGSGQQLHSQHKGHLMEATSSNKPGVESWDTSGTTISEPVKSHLSPAWADSTASARRMTSTLRGMLPRGSSPCVSWMRTWHGQKAQSPDLKLLQKPHCYQMCLTASDCCHPHQSLLQYDKQPKIPSLISIHGA